MSTVKDIEAAISRLSHDDLAEVRTWFAEFEAQTWADKLKRMPKADV